MDLRPETSRFQSVYNKIARGVKNGTVSLAQRRSACNCRTSLRNCIGNFIFVINRVNVVIFQVSLSENGGASAAEGDSPAVIRPGHSLVVPSKVGIRLVNQHTVSTLDKKSASKAASIPKNMFQIDFQSILEGSTEGPCLAVIAAVGGASCTTF